MMHKHGMIRYANYTVCASVFIHFCMQRKNNENIPIIDMSMQIFCPKAGGDAIVSTDIVNN